MFAYQWPSPWFDSQTMKPDGPRTALLGVDERQETVKTVQLGWAECHRYHASSERSQCALDLVAIKSRIRTHRYVAELHTRWAHVGRCHRRRRTLDLRGANCNSGQDRQLSLSTLCRRVDRATVVASGVLVAVCSGFAH